MTEYGLNEYRVVTAVNKMGKILLRSGAETSRVENMLIEVCEHFKLNAQCFVTVTCIITSVRTEKNSIFSAVERVHGVSNNLNNIDRIQIIVSNITKYSIETFEKELIKIENEISYKNIIMMISHCFAAVSFCLLFKGGFKDTIVAGLGGIIVYFILKVSSSLKITNFFINTLCGFLATSIATFMYNINFLNSPSSASIGTIMLLVPGLALTNAIRDLINGDLLSGISRAVEAALIGTALGIGTGFSLFLFS